MFLPWSIFGRSAKQNRTMKQGAKKAAKAQAVKPRFEQLEDRTLLATFHVDISYTGFQDGGIATPFRTIQQALTAANANAGHDDIIVYGNNSGDPSKIYVWDRDGDADGNGVNDGNLVLSDNGIFGNTVNVTFRATDRFGVFAPLILKMRNNIIDVGTDCQLRIEGQSSQFRVIITSTPDDSAGGDTNGDGNINAPNRADWGGIRFRAGAVDQGLNNPNLGSIVNWADLRYTGATLFDEVAGDQTEFGSIRMEGDITTPGLSVDQQRAQIRVWNTIFRNGGRALDVHIWSLEGRGPDLGYNPTLAGGVGAQPLTFVNNSINGCFINIPFITDPADPRFGQVIQLDQNAQLDDVGVPYVLTQRFVLANDVEVTIDPAIIIKSQRVTLDSKDAADVNDNTSGKFFINGLVERPVLFTSLTDDALVPNTILSQFYSNGSADTNNDGNLTAPAPGDWAGIRLSQGWMDHAFVRYAGGLYPLQGTFVNSAAVTIFAQDRRDIGGVQETVRVSNTDISRTFTGFELGTFYDSPALEVFSRDWNQFIQRTGDITVIDNYIHDNQGKSIYAHPLAFHDLANSSGGYGIQLRRNVLERNANNSVYVRFILDRGSIPSVDRNISRVGGYFDDTDIVHTIDGQMLLVHQDQAFQMQSRRGVNPGIANGSFLDRYSDEASFVTQGLVMQLPGIPAIPLERGPASINPTIFDSGLFYYKVDFESTARGVALGNNPQNNPVTTLYGEEWRDWGVDFTTSASMDLKPFYIRGNVAGDPDPSGAFSPGNNFFAVNTAGNGSVDLTFPNAVSAVGFYIVDNETTSPNERIEFIGVDGQLIESIALPTTSAANNRVFVGRVSRQPIWKVRIYEDANDSVINNHSATYSSSFTPITIPDNGSSVTGQLSILEPGSPITITDLNVKVNINHPRVSDLLVQLEGPDGTRITLANRASAPGALGANYTNTYFDDQAAVPVELGAAPFSASFRPTQSLAAFNGKTINGTWKLIVTDQASGPGGAATIQNFSLTFAGTGANVTPDAIGIDDLYFVDAGQDLVVKAANANTVITSGAVQSGYREVTQNAAGVITDGISHDGSAITIVGSGANARGFGGGGTLRILGQANNPVVLTTINDNTVGAGVVGHVQKNTQGSPNATGTAGDWLGVQVLPGSNNAKTVVVTQQPNGSINTRYADVNPYTLGDEPDTYFAGAQSYRELVLTAGLHSLIPNSTETRVMMQDGTLIEYATIKFASVGIDHQGYPESKLQIDGAELELNRANPDESRPDVATTRINPTPHWILREDGTWVFNTVSGAYRAQARLGGTSENPLTGTDDVDWWQFEDPSSRRFIYADVQTGDPAADAAGANPFAVYGFNYQFQLTYAAGLNLSATFGWALDVFVLDADGNLLTGAAAAAALDNSGGALGPIEMRTGDNPWTLNNQVRDTQYVAITGAATGRLPRSLIPTTASPAGLLPQNTILLFSALPSTGPVGSNGFTVDFFDQDFNQIDIPQGDSVWNPEPGLSGPFLGGYEVEFRREGLDTTRDDRPVRLGEGEFVYRNNLILQSGTAAVRVRDFREDQPSNTNLGEDFATQTARFGQDNANAVTNTNGNPFINNDFFLPGVQVYNNLIVGGSGNGIVLTENAPGTGEPPANLWTPTMFATVHNNTIDSVAGIGILYTGRGGANIFNNILSNAATGVQFVKTPDIEPARPTIQPVVSYNLFYNNGTNIAQSGSINGTQNLFNVDPRFVDRPNLDYRLFIASPAVDSAISNISDRLSATRYAQEPLRAPTTDLRGRSRVDNPTKPNVGAGQFPFYDRGALEATEPPLRVIGLSVFTSNQLIGQPVTQVVMRFFGRVDMSTINSTTVRLLQDNGTPVGLGAIAESYDPTTNVHTITAQLQSTLINGTYTLTLKGTSTGVSDPGIRDISGQLLDGEFPTPYSFPSGNGIAGGSLVYTFTIRTASVSGTVWNNPNGNNTIDAGELGLGAVGMLLTWAGSDGVFGTADDVNLPQQLTSALGAYSFTGLQPGNYRLDVNGATLPGSFFLNTPPAPRFFTLTFGQDLTGQNFGYWQDFSNASIGNLVWDDLNGDGIRQAGEPALGGVIVEALWAGRDRTFGTADDQVFTESTTLTANGNFLFNARLPAGEYRVSVNPGSLPGGYLRTTQLGAGQYPIEFLLLPGSSNVGIQIGFQQRNSSIGDTVFDDLNGNGVQDAGEPGLGGVQMVLTRPDGSTVFTTTDANGNYLFGSLPAGTYTVTVVAATLPPNYYSTTRNSPLTVTLPDGNTQRVDADFGFRQDPLTGQIGALVWRDDDGNRVQNGGEPGLAGVQVLLTWAGRDGVFGTADDQNFSQNTNASGNYLFTALPIGYYRVQLGAGVPPGFALTTPTTVPYPIELGDGGFGPPNSNLTANFGLQAANAVINGSIFADLNGNGLLDVVPNETGRYGGVRVFIDANNNGAFDAGEKFAVSALGTGAWSIGGLASGQYKVMIDPTTIPAVPGGLSASPSFIMVDVPPSATVGSVNLGLFQQNAQVSGRIFNDINGNGAQDFGEQALGGVDVTLIWFGTNNVFENGAGDDVVYVATTNANGDYLFTALPGAFAPGANFHIQVDVGDVPPGSVPTIPNPPALDLRVDIGGSKTQNFGFRVPPTALPGVFYLTLNNPGSLPNSDGTTQPFFNSDIIKLKTQPNGDWAYSLYFRGSSFGLTPNTGESLDALTFLNTGQILVSTSGNFSVKTNYSNGVGSGATITGFGGDLLRFTPTAFGAAGNVTAGSWSLYFRGSRVGLSGSRGNVDAVAPIYNAAGSVVSLLLSTTGQVTAKNVTANNYDILKFNISALGASTAGTFEMYFKGSNVGLADPTNENIDALHLVTGGAGLPSLVLSTTGNFSVSGGVTGNRNTAIQFDPTTLGNATAGTWGTVRLEGNNFGMGSANITGLFIGAAPGDPNPLTAAGHKTAADADLDSKTIRWAEGKGAVSFFIDLSAFSADQIARIRDAAQTVGQAFAKASGMSLVETADAAQADIRIGMKAGDGSGLLGQVSSFAFDEVISGFLRDGRAYRTFIGHENGGVAEINFMDGWNWYAGANARQIGRNQYDLQSVATHELGHMLGLGENRTVRNSVMFETLAAGQTRRAFAKADAAALNKLYDERPILVDNRNLQLDGGTVGSLQRIEAPRARLPRTDLTEIVRETVRPTSNGRSAQAAAADELFAVGSADAADLSLTALPSRGASLADRVVQAIG